MGKYNLTIADIETGVNRLLAEAYATATVSDNPELAYIAAGPGAGKTSVEIYLKRLFKEKGERAFEVSSDKIAEFHPQYDEALEELPEECYRITRKFVRPATPKIFEKLRENRINIINENTLDKGESDIELARKFKESGYRISVNIMATDIFESRLSCYEREARTLMVGLTPRGCAKETQIRMYNSFINGVKGLEREGLLDEINVYTRGENINKPPVLKYKKGDIQYVDFEEAIYSERKKQRESIFRQPEKYLDRISNTEATIARYGTNMILTENAIKGLTELKEDFIRERAMEKDK